MDTRGVMCLSSTKTNETASSKNPPISNEYLGLVRPGGHSRVAGGNHQQSPGLGFAAVPVIEVTAHFHSPSAPQGRMAGSPLPAALRFRAPERPVQLRVFRNAAFSKEMQVLMFRLTFQETVSPQTN